MYPEYFNRFRVSELFATVIMKSTKVQTLGAYHSSYHELVNDFICVHIATNIEELAEYMSVYGWKRTLHALTEIFRKGE